MGFQSTLAKSHFQTPERAGSYALFVDGKDISNKVASISGGYEEENGASSFTFTLTDPDFDLAFYEDAMCDLWIGYGDFLEPFISGRLVEPVTQDDDTPPSARVLGAFAEMGSQFIGGGDGRGRDRDFTGQTVESASVMLGRLAGMPLDSIEVRGGSDIEIREGYMTAETNLLEASTAAITSLGFVQSDRPGYKRLVMPEPVPGANDPFLTEYTESDWETDGFTVQRSNSTRFASVVVFRRDDTGGYPVWETASVANRTKFRVPLGRVHWIPEFSGTPLQAYREANRQAVKLAEQGFTFSLGVPINAELLPYKMIRCSRVERRARRRVRVTYVCMITRLSFEISAETFAASYEGVAREIGVVDVTETLRVRPVRSAGIVVRIERGLRPSKNLMPKLTGLRPSRDRKAGV